MSIRILDVLLQPLSLAAKQETCLEAGPLTIYLGQDSSITVRGVPSPVREWYPKYYLMISDKRYWGVSLYAIYHWDTGRWELEYNYLYPALSEDSIIAILQRIPIHK